MANETDTAEKWETYGNNYFVLTCINNEATSKGEPLKLDGVMREIPSISMSSEWQETPAAALGDKLNEYLNNPAVQFITAKTATNTTRMLSKDAMTSRMFKSGTPPTFEIKFRCYPGQKIGPHHLNTAKEWMLFLSYTTPIGSENGYSVSSTLDQWASAGVGIGKALKSLLGDEEEKDANMSKFNASVAAVEADNTGKTFSVTGVNARADHKTYGSHLFTLKILPFIYNELCVYISSWTVTPSKEWNNAVNDHYYYDFSITCNMDRVPSAITWLKHLMN